eukprot:TRINITY_DN8497_c0_g1_i1.p1 TRINITY_DN8497_c0_g1~~TRINITY_DN8497_c0_g1_i1.p1  ORF type:complete len:1147 (+),score=248.08 TRINITY_DN8497_c0_g1_i1:293-3442(+)
MEEEVASWLEEYEALLTSEFSLSSSWWGYVSEEALIAPCQTILPIVYSMSSSYGNLEYESRKNTRTWRSSELLGSPTKNKGLSPPSPRKPTLSPRGLSPGGGGGGANSRVSLRASTSELSYNTETEGGGETTGQSPKKSGGGSHRLSVGGSSLRTPTPGELSSYTENTRGRERSAVVMGETPGLSPSWRRRTRESGEEEKDYVVSMMGSARSSRLFEKIGSVQGKDGTSETQTEEKVKDRQKKKHKVGEEEKQHKKKHKDVDIQIETDTTIEIEKEKEVDEKKENKEKQTEVDIEIEKPTEGKKRKEKGKEKSELEMEKGKENRKDHARLSWSSDCLISPGNNFSRTHVTSWVQENDIFTVRAATAFKEFTFFRARNPSRKWNLIDELNELQEARFSFMKEKRDYISGQNIYRLKCSSQLLSMNARIDAVVDHERRLIAHNSEPLIMNGTISTPKNKRLSMQPRNLVSQLKKEGDPEGTCTAVYPTSEWSLPSLDVDPFLLSGAEIEHYTARRKNDLKSFQFQEGQLISASVRDLFLRLVRVGEKQFQRTFFYCVDYFASKQQILNLFVLMYRKPPEEINTMKRRFEQKIIDLLVNFFRVDSNLEFYERFINYLKTGQEPNAIFHAEQLTIAWNRALLVDFALKPALPQVTENKSFCCLVDVKAKEIAEQLTLQEQAFYMNVGLSEYLHLNWSKEKAKTTSPNLLAYIDRFNSISYWVVTMILKSSVKEVPITISFWIKVLKHLIELNNFNSSMAVYSALNNINVTKLKRAWQKVPSTENIKAFACLLENGFKLYRARLSTIKEEKKPCIPIQSLLLHDLSMIEEMDNFMEDGLVHWQKMIIMGDTFHTMETLKSHRYQVREQEAVQALINSREVATEEEIEALSQVLIQGESEVPVSLVGTSVMKSAKQQAKPKKLKIHKTKKVEVPKKFSEVDPNSCTYSEFTNHPQLPYLANLIEAQRVLKVYRSPTPPWTSGERAIVGHTICAYYLGLEEEEPVLKLPSEVVNSVKKAVHEHPGEEIDPLVFAGVEEYLSRTIEDLYTRFLEKFA